MNSNYPLTRRQFVTGVGAAGVLAFGNSATATESFGPKELSGRYFELNIGYLPVNFTGKDRTATAINGSIPAPTLRWKEGEEVTIKVTNHLAEDTSIHWHGIILPSNMDGVPGLSFGGIKPGESFTYRFTVNQSGTYWYHSHSGFQEPLGMYGAIIVDPIEAHETVERDYVLTLSDWSDEKPESTFANLKKYPHIYNIDERTLNDFMRDSKRHGFSKAFAERIMWNQMRMSDSDISDVTGKTYTFLLNGKPPANHWQALFKNGERVRLRFINAASMTFFDVRIPGVKMTVVAADGQAIEPVTVDEFRIAAAETYDVIVQPSAEQAHAVFCQAIDRSGYAVCSLTPQRNLPIDLPELDASPILGHIDMGMNHLPVNADAGHDQHGMNHGGQTSQKDNQDEGGCTEEHAAMGHCVMPQKPSNNGCTAEHAAMGHCVMPNSEHRQMGSGSAGYGSSKAVSFDHIKMGPHIDMLAESPQYRLDDPGVGLRNNGRRVLTYADLINRNETLDPREPSRELELHLTGNMSRYMWSIDGIKGMKADPIKMKFGERLRITFVNNTMMNHPMHLHGLWSELETGEPNRIPRKHTTIVQPGSRLSYLVTADALGKWAYHCHLTYHMPSMFRVVEVS